MLLRHYYGIIYIFEKKEKKKIHNPVMSLCMTTDIVNTDIVATAMDSVTKGKRITIP